MPQNASYCPSCGAHEFEWGGHIGIKEAPDYEELVTILGHALDLLGTLGTSNMQWDEKLRLAKEQIRVTAQS